MIVRPRAGTRGLAMRLAQAAQLSLANVANLQFSLGMCKRSMRQTTHAPPGHPRKTNAGYAAGATPEPLATTTAIRCGGTACSAINLISGKKHFSTGTDAALAIVELFRNIFD